MEGKGAGCITGSEEFVILFRVRGKFLESFDVTLFQSFSSSGLVILLNWVQTVEANSPHPEYTNNNSYCDFNKERGKVSVGQTNKGFFSYHYNFFFLVWYKFLNLMDGKRCEVRRGARKFCAVLHQPESVSREIGQLSIKCAPGN